MSLLTLVNCGVGEPQFVLFILKDKKACEAKISLRTKQQKQRALAKRNLYSEFLGIALKLMLLTGIGFTRVENNG